MDYLNRLLRKGGGGSNKKSEKDLSPKSHLNNNNREAEIEPDFISSQHSTPKKAQDCDTESDTTADYESAGEASPWKEKSTNLSALAETLAGVHLSTPDKIHKDLNHFPYSPITAEDEDEEVMSITSNNSHNSGAGSLSLMNEETSKNVSLNDILNVPPALLNSSQVIGTLENDQVNKITDVSSLKSEGFKSISLNQSEALPPVEVMNNPLNTSSLNEPKVISPFVEFEDAGPACSFHSELMNSITGVNSSMLSNTSLIEDCRHETCDKSQAEILTKILENDELDPEFDMLNLSFEITKNLPGGSSPSKLDKNKTAILKHILFDMPIDSLTASESNPSCEKVEITSTNDEESKDIDAVESVHDSFVQSSMPSQTTDITEQKKLPSDISKKEEAQISKNIVEGPTASQDLNSKNQNPEQVSKLIDEKQAINPEVSASPLDPKVSTVEPEDDKNTTVSIDSSTVLQLENVDKNQLKETGPHPDIHLPEVLENAIESPPGKTVLSNTVNQNLPNVSDSVLRLANEKHPACIEDSPEKIKTLVSPLKILTSDQIVTGVIPDTVVEKNEVTNKGNLSISEMCTLIETTFNNALEENEDEVFTKNTQVIEINEILSDIKESTDNLLIPQAALEAPGNENTNSSTISNGIGEETQLQDKSLVDYAVSDISISQEKMLGISEKVTSIPTTNLSVSETELNNQKEIIPLVRSNEDICAEKVQNTIPNIANWEESPSTMAMLHTELSNLSIDPIATEEKSLPCTKDVEGSFSSLHMESEVSLNNNSANKITNEISVDNILNKAVNMLDTSDVSLKKKSTIESLALIGLNESPQIPKTPNNSINSSQDKTPCQQEIQSQLPSGQSSQTEYLKTENYVITSPLSIPEANKCPDNVSSEALNENEVETSPSKNSGASFVLSFDDPDAPNKTPQSKKKPQLSRNSPRSQSHRPKRVLEYPPNMKNLQPQNTDVDIEKSNEPQLQSNEAHNQPEVNSEINVASSLLSKEKITKQELNIDSPIQNIKGEVPEKITKEQIKLESLSLDGQNNKLGNVSSSLADTNDAGKQKSIESVTHDVQAQILDNDSTSATNEILESLSVDDPDKKSNVISPLLSKDNNTIVKTETIPEVNQNENLDDVFPLAPEKSIEKEDLEVKSAELDSLNEKLEDAVPLPLNELTTTKDRLNIQSIPVVDHCDKLSVESSLVSKENADKAFVKLESISLDAKNENLDNVSLPTKNEITLNQFNKVSVPLVSEKIADVLSNIPKGNCSDDQLTHQALPLAAIKEHSGDKTDIADCHSKVFSGMPSSLPKDCNVIEHSKTESTCLDNQSIKPAGILPLNIKEAETSEQLKVKSNLSDGNESASVTPSIFKENSSNAQLQLKSVPSSDLPEKTKNISQSLSIDNLINEQMFIQKQLCTISASAENGSRDDMVKTEDENLKQDTVSPPSCIADTGGSAMGLSQSHMTRSVDDLKSSSTEIFKSTPMSRSTIEVGSYEDLLDKCSEQERLLGFDDSIKEEAEKLAKELHSPSINDGITSPKASNEILQSSRPETLPEAVGTLAADEEDRLEESKHYGEGFKDGINFDFEFLSKIRGKPGQSKKTRESLFLKFDPLASPLAEPKTPVRRTDMALPDSSSDVTMNCDPMNGEEGLLVSITPTSNSRNSREEPTPSPTSINTPKTRHRHSVGQITPTLRHEILSKEISKLQDIMVRQESSYQEQLAAYGEEIDELRRKIAEYETQEPIDDLKSNLAMANAEVDSLQLELKKQLTIKDQLMYVIQEFESTSEALIKKRDIERQEFHQEREALLSEKETLEKHLKIMETSFNDVHQKYEKSKQAIELFKQNEKEFLQSLQINEQTIKQQNENYQKLKEHASQKLEQANVEILEMNKAHQAEMAKLQAINKKMQMQIKTLEETVELKSREIVELTKICDELIKVSGA